MVALQLSDLRKTAGFSLVELVIVVVIIGLIAAIAVPRFTRASQGAAEAGLRANLKMLRDAIETYSVEHEGNWPAYRPAGPSAGHASADAFNLQLTAYTDSSGLASDTKGGTFTLGRYLERIPPLPLGVNRGYNAVLSLNFLGPTPSGTSGYGWEYCHYTGEIRTNLPRNEIGSNGIPYCDW